MPWGLSETQGDLSGTSASTHNTRKQPPGQWNARQIWVQRVFHFLAVCPGESFNFSKPQFTPHKIIKIVIRDGGEEEREDVLVLT